MAVAIRTEGLTKDYGESHGLFDLDLEVAAGEVFGYLGPNGAGKTTTIRLLMDLVRPTHGRAEIFGVDCHAHPVEVKRMVGYLPGEMPQWGGLRGRDVVAYVGGLRGGVDAARVKQPRRAPRPRPRPSLPAVLVGQQAQARAGARLHAPVAAAGAR